ncbi:MAG: protein kinase [Lachnospiraceae bacterium]|nr:protein kinase [Lachnospiraceae bacterium]
MIRRKRKDKKRTIPEAMGNRLCGVWPYIFVVVMDAAVHATILFAIYGVTPRNFLRLFFSFLFFIYPLYYCVDELWSIRPSVSAALSGEIPINRKHYMNTVRKEVVRDTLLPVTVSIPVYTESNEVIFKTIQDSLAAAKRYRDFSGKAANVVVSDDGLAPLCGGFLTAEKADDLFHAMKHGASGLTETERKAAERIVFYRKHDVPYVVRPAANRPGLFKKASNLNYTLRLCKALESGATAEELTGGQGDFAGGFLEGDITTHEVILLLDKDSGVKEGIIEAILPEFAADGKLAYVQCATRAENTDENIYTYATGRHINNLFHNIWPCKALQGFFVPLVGHNVFLRRSHLEESGLWAEDRVSEDYDKALSFYRIGCHGKYAQIRGLEFTECASRTFTEETEKQRRYAYGMYEMLFDGTVFSDRIRGNRGCDIFYMLLYFCSILNQTLLLPTVLYECYLGNIHLLWAGFLVCMMCFISLPLIRGVVMKGRLPNEYTAGVWHTIVIAVSFVGHSFSVLSASFRYITNKFRENATPFPSSNVTDLQYRFRDGIRLATQYVKKNPLFVVIAFLCLDRGVFLVTQKGLAPVTVITYGYILFCTVLIPIFFTPVLYVGFGGKSASTEKTEGYMNRERQRDDTDVWKQSGSSIAGATLSPRVIEKEPDSAFEDDMALFLEGYQETLLSSLAEDDMPEELFLAYDFESCLRKDPEGRKELYLLRRRKDGILALLRITKDYPEEDALEEARILERLDHPGVPKVLGAYEKDGKKYLVREYVEGRTLHEILSVKGSLSAEDVFGIARKLAKILQYLHAQTPPVIHRDIKPQNIIAGRDGSLHLIDFGIAREHKLQRRQDTAVVLTLDYASPEQYGFEQTTPLSDIYSLGVVLLYLATGRTVRADLEAQIINNRLRELIKQCIAFNPKDRIQSADELLIRLKKDYDPRARKHKRRGAAVAGVAAAAVCLSVLSYGTGFAAQRRNASAGGYERGYQAGYTDGYDAAPKYNRNYEESTAADGTDFQNMSAPGGAFAAGGGAQIYFVADDGIWSMTAGGTNQTLLIADEAASSLSFRDGWLYYASGDRMMQTNVYTSVSDELYRGQTGSLCVNGDDFYFRSEEGVALLDLKTGESTALEPLAGCKRFFPDGSGLYYIDGADQTLYRCSLTGENPERILAERCRNVCLYNGEMLCAAEADGAEGIVRVNGDTGQTQLLIEARADLLQRTKDSICYLDLSDNRIYRCSVDGRIRERVSANRAQDYNLAGGWIFYHNEDDSGRLWCVRLDGSNDHPSSGR